MTQRTAPQSALISALTARIAAEGGLPDAIDRIRFGADASAYRLDPRVVVIAADVADVQAVLEVAHQTGTSVTFRGAGTSLSGQAQSDGILCEVQRHWRGLTVEKGGSRVRVRPGTTGAAVNAALGRHDRRLGPDPASIDACTVGGIVANNASGMCCGVEHNAYQTLASVTFVLASGVVIDTADPHADRKFIEQAPELATTLSALRADLTGDAELAALVRTKHRLKNTTGYGLNALLDHDRPVDIFAHLLVGSEGTLAFLAEIVLDTVPLDRCRLTTLILFSTIEEACAAVPAMQASGARAVELMDGASLSAVQAQLAAVMDGQQLTPNSAALLVEWQEADEESLARRATAAAAALDELGLSITPELHRAPDIVAGLWAVRKGMLTAVGGLRPPGTSVILEDVVFPPARLVEGTIGLRGLLDEHGYDGVIFGHARDGNLHFLISAELAVASEARRYAAFMAALVQLVVSLDGALKGEHGTGRNMAPFVATEWGGRAVEMMRQIKDAADPGGILNPGVILPSSPTAHVENLKPTPLVDPETDRCVECGFCERVCPSADLTTTPRQRIVLRRRLAELQTSDPSSPDLAALTRDLSYPVIDTCAVDGLCQVACPVDINTGDLVKRLRAERHGRTARQLAKLAASRFTRVERAARWSLRVAGAARRVTGASRAERATARLARSLRTWDAAPVLLEATPGAAGPLPPTSRAGARAVYLPSCVNRILGSPAGGMSTVEAMVRVAERAGRPVWIPADVAGSCCATPFSSKGFPAAAAQMAGQTVDKVWRWTDAGRIPLVTDASSCAMAFKGLDSLLHGDHRARWREVTWLDSIDYVAELIDDLEVRRVKSAVVHPTCANSRDGTAGRLLELVGLIADEVQAPASPTCCGFAGDRGFLRPELTAAATAQNAADISAGHQWYVSANRPCEIAMEQATGMPFTSYVVALEHQSR